MTIITPYRNRLEHLNQFVAAMYDHDIYIIEQADDKPFNRGKLINCGFLEIRPINFVANDIDMITPFFPASLYNAVVQLALSSIQHSDYLGGSTLYSSFSFEHSGGYHNDFWHRAEDNEMRFNLKRQGIPVIYMPQSFTLLPHPRTTPEFIPELWVKAQLPRTVDMLKTCHYTLVSKEAMTGYTLIKVKL